MIRNKFVTTVEVLAALEDELARLPVWHVSTNNLPHLMARVEVLRLRDFQRGNTTARDLRRYQIAQGLIPIWAAKYITNSGTELDLPDWAVIDQLIAFAGKYHDIKNIFDGVSAGAFELTRLPRRVRVHHPQMRGMHLRLKFPAREAYHGRLLAFEGIRSDFLAEATHPPFRSEHLERWYNDGADARTLTEEAVESLMLMAIRHVSLNDKFLPLTAQLDRGASIQEAKNLWTAAVYFALLTDFQAMATGYYWPPMWDDEDQAATHLAAIAGVSTATSKVFVNLVIHRRVTDPDAALAPILRMPDGLYAFGSLILASNFERNILRLLFSRRSAGGRVGNQLGAAEERIVGEQFAKIPGVRILTRPNLYDASSRKHVGEFDLVLWSEAERFGLVCEVKWWPRPDGYRESVRLLGNIKDAQALLLENSGKVLSGAWRYGRKRHVPGPFDVEWSFLIVGPSYFAYGDQVLDSPMTDVSMEAIGYEISQIREPTSLRDIVSRLSRINPPISNEEFWLSTRSYNCQGMVVMIEDVRTHTTIERDQLLD